MNNEIQKVLYCASFDIGKVNFAFCIEEIDLEKLSLLENIPKSKRYNVNGTPTDEMKMLLDNINKNGRTILLKNIDLTQGCVKGKYIDTEIFHNLTDLLDQYKEYWDICSYFVIEQQMSFGKKHNTLAMKIGQHCQSFFFIMYSRFKNVIEFPAFHKTQILGAEKNKINKNGKIFYKTIDKPARKKWSIIKAKDIFSLREDYSNLEIISHSRKKDDLADVVTQLAAFKYLMFIDRSISI